MEETKRSNTIQAFSDNAAECSYILHCRIKKETIAQNVTVAWHGAPELGEVGFVTLHVSTYQLILN